MKNLLNASLAVALMLTVSVAAAQPAKPKPVAKPGATQPQKFRPPKVKTYLGRCTDSIAVTREEAKQLVGLPLRISDAKNVNYSVVSYQFAYTRIAVTEDEATGRVLPTTSLVAEMFKTSPLPELWQENIKATVRNGEQFYFFDVIAKDAQGHLFFAPELKISIRQ
jgi:hypothetical protein